MHITTRAAQALNVRGNITASKGNELACYWLGSDAVVFCSSVT